jgi:hypothetical protein
MSGSAAQRSLQHSSSLQRRRLANLHCFGAKSARDSFRRHGELWLMVEQELLGGGQLVDGDLPVDLHEQQRTDTNRCILCGLQCTDHRAEVLHQCRCDDRILRQNKTSFGDMRCRQCNLTGTGRSNSHLGTGPHSAKPRSEDGIVAVLNLKTCNSQEICYGVLDLPVSCFIGEVDRDRQGQRTGPIGICLFPIAKFNSGLISGKAGKGVNISSGNSIRETAGLDEDVSRASNLAVRDDYASAGQNVRNLPDQSTSSDIGAVLLILTLIFDYHASGSIDDTEPSIVSANYNCGTGIQNNSHRKGAAVLDQPYQHDPEQLQHKARRRQSNRHRYRGGLKLTGLRMRLLQHSGQPRHRAHFHQERVKLHGRWLPGYIDSHPQSDPLASLPPLGTRCLTTVGHAPIFAELCLGEAPGASPFWRALRGVLVQRRFLSCEPLLGPIGLQAAMWTLGSERRHGQGASHVHVGGCCARLHGLDWVIAGAESGPGARRMDPDWVRALREQCTAAGAAFFYKQDADRRGRKIPTPELDGRTWTQMPTAASR